MGNISLSYDFKKVLKFFTIYNEINKNWKLIFVNNYINSKEKQKIFKNFPHKKNIVHLSSNFEKISKIYKKFDCGIYFLKKDFSKIASCPTKLGEMLASGIPIITNSGIGDINLYLNSKKKCGFILDNLSKSNIKEIDISLNNKYKYLSMKNNSILIANKFFEKDKNLFLYDEIYKKLI